MSGSTSSSAPGSGSAVAPVTPKQAGDRWGSVNTSPIPSERADSPDLCNKRWDKIHAKFGAKADKTKDEVFAAVQGYFAKNGCSPEGGYNGEIIAAGVAHSANVIVSFTGKADGAVRKFLRGRLQESVDCLKYSSVCTGDAEMVAEALMYGLAPEQAWLLADWIAPKNPYLTSDEMDVAMRVRSAKIAKANANRGGVQVGVKGATTVAEPESMPAMPTKDETYSTRTMYG